MKKLFTTILIIAPLLSFGQLQKDLAAMIQANSDKVIALAEAIPADKYSWSPSEGVRDVQGVLMHITGANYFFPGLWGVNPPEGVDMQKLGESVSGKEDAIKVLKESYAFVMEAVGEFPDDKMSEEFDFYGTKMTRLQALLLAYGHCEEHMGQLIAYARANDITPPWSMAE